MLGGRPGRNPGGWERPVGCSPRISSVVATRWLRLLSLFGSGRAAGPLARLDPRSSCFASHDVERPAPGRPRKTGAERRPKGLALRGRSGAGQRRELRRGEHEGSRASGGGGILSGRGGGGARRSRPKAVGVERKAGRSTAGGARPREGSQRNPRRTRGGARGAGRGDWSGEPGPGGARARPEGWWIFIAINMVRRSLGCKASRR